VSETKEFRHSFNREATASSELKNLTCTIQCYRGLIDPPRWKDVDNGEYFPFTLILPLDYYYFKLISFSSMGTHFFWQAITPPCARSTMIFLKCPSSLFGVQTDENTRSWCTRSCWSLASRNSRPMWHGRTRWVAKFSFVNTCWSLHLSRASRSEANQRLSMILICDQALTLPSWNFSSYPLFLCFLPFVWVLLDWSPQLLYNRDTWFGQCTTEYHKYNEWPCSTTSAMSLITTAQILLPIAVTSSQV